MEPTAPKGRGWRKLIASAAAVATATIGAGVASAAGGGGVSSPNPPILSDVVCVSGCAGERQATIGARVRLTGRDLDSAGEVRFAGEGGRITVAPASVGATSLEAKVPKGGGPIRYELRYADIPDVTQAHLHFAQKGVNGGIVVFICSNLGNGPAGTPACPAGSATLTGDVTSDDVLATNPNQGIAAGELDELAPSPDQIMDRDDRAALDRLRRRQAMNQERTQQLGERAGQRATDLPADSLRFGSASLTTADQSTTAKPQWLYGYWQDGAQVFWDDLRDDGRLVVRDPDRRRRRGRRSRPRGGRRRAGVHAPAAPHPRWPPGPGPRGRRPTTGWHVARRRSRRPCRPVAPAPLRSAQQASSRRPGRSAP